MFMIFPYTQNSAGAIAIAKELDGKRILRTGSAYVYKPSDVVINWGASDCPFPQALNYNNKNILNKLVFFRKLANTGLTPRYVEDEAAASLLNFPVFCRTKLTGKDGSGIVIANNPNELVDCDLYTEAVAKSAEYRVHVGRLPNGMITILGAQKKWVPDPNKLDNKLVWAGEGTNFVWTVDGLPIVLPESVADVAGRTLAEFPELTFAAMDIVYDNVFKRAFVLEANSAPTITPKTAELYGVFFRQFEGVGGVAPAPTFPEAVPVAVAPVPVLGDPTDTLFITVKYDASIITPEWIEATINSQKGIINVQL
jgi:hypothetical protein